jgi:serine protease
MKSLLTALKSLMALTLLLAFSSTALAARYLVVMKNKGMFLQTHAQMLVSENRNLAAVMLVQNGQLVKPFAEVDVEVEDSLENLDTLVINSEDDSAMQLLAANASVGVIEKEYFYPAPAPIAGFELSKPWAYDLGAASSENRVGTQSERTPWGIDAVRAPQAWTLSRQGQGARVAALDTGIDKDHPALKGNFEQGRDFVNDHNAPYSFADKMGHGTHVAGTIGAVMMSDGFVGVAPRVRLLAGRVCGEDGCSNIAVAQGINWAIAQKVDVISMSLGGPMPTPAEKKAIESADRAGITVVAASGNDGVAKVGYPAAFPSVIAVGAVDKTIKKAAFSQWGPELAVVAPGVDVISSVPQGTGRESRVTVSGKSVPSTSFQGAPEITTPLSNTVVFAGLGKPEDFKKINVAGKFALIRRGELKFAEKVQNAIAANASGVVIFNNEAGLLQGSLTEDGSTVAVPVVMIEQAVGEEVVKSLTGGTKVAVTIQTSPSDYASFMGTSMATPHVAGIVALMKATNKNLKPAQVKAILKATALPLEPNNENQTGSGFVNAEKAVAEAKRR